MSVELNVSAGYDFESANYITFINPGLHPDRILPFHDFLYIIDGTWEIIEEENVYKLHSDDLIILAAGRHHYGKEPCSANNKHMYIHACERATGEGGESDNTDKKLFHTVIHCQNNPVIKQLFEAVIQASWSEEPLKEEKRSLLFGLLLCELYHQQNRDTALQMNIVQQAVQLIQTNPQILFNGKDVAEHFYICQRTLNNQFKKVYGKTFNAYQTDMKLEMVKQYLLNHPDTRLEEVARNFGFCDEFHLGKAYKAKYGISPKRHTRDLLLNLTF